MPINVGCEAENIPQSEHSPGVVENHELICRGIRAPIDLTNGEVNRNPFKIDELTSKALSTYRQSPECYDQKGAIEKLKSWVAQKPGQKLHSIYRASALD